MAISVNDLYGKEGKYDWLKSQEKVKKVGYSIWIYRVNPRNDRQTKDL
jgi:hypothetical protein